MLPHSATFEEQTAARRAKEEARTRRSALAFLFSSFSSAWFVSGGFDTPYERKLVDSCPRVRHGSCAMQCGKLPVDLSKRLAGIEHRTSETYIFRS